MEFSQVLERIARPAEAEDASLHRSAALGSADFWQVLDRLAEAPPVSDQTLKAAYFSEDFVATPALKDVPETQLSIDPEDVADELALSHVVSLEELSRLRRQFAMLNHPDRVAADQHGRATTRMTIANAMIDEAQARFSL